MSWSVSTLLFFWDLFNIRVGNGDTTHISPTEADAVENRERSTF